LLESEATMRPHLLLLFASLFCAMPAIADEMPQRKPGLWEIKMTMGGQEVPLRGIQQCIDAATDALMTTNVGGAMGGECAKPRISSNSSSSSNSSITVDSTCKIGSTTTSTRAVIAGDFNSAYTITITQMPAEGAAHAGSGGQPQMVMQAKWIGPCRQGQRPGDIMMPGGVTINVRDLAIGSGAPPRR
jgi:hypothetical protein